LLSAGKKVPSDNYSIEITRNLKTNLFFLTLQPTFCIGKNSKLILELTAERAETINEKYALANKKAEIIIKPFCPLLLAKKEIDLLISSQFIESETSWLIRYLLVAFSNINFNMISASEILSLSKFLQIQFPANLLAFFDGQSSKNFFQNFLLVFTAKRKKFEINFPEGSNFLFFRYSIFA